MLCLAVCARTQNQLGDVVCDYTQEKSASVLLKKTVLCSFLKSLLLNFLNKVRWSIGICLIRC